MFAVRSFTQPTCYLSLKAIFNLIWLSKIAIPFPVMNLAYAQPDKTWGQRPCEGSVSSLHIRVSGRGLAARRTHPGLGAACKGSNAADRDPRSYGGQCFCWPEQRSYHHVQERRSAPAAAPQATFEATVSLHRRRDHVSSVELGHAVLGVNPGAFNGSGGDPFTAQGIGYA